MKINHTAVVPAALLLTALFPLPYGYYNFLRLVVTIWAAFFAWKEFKGGADVSIWAVGFVLTAILFNPIAPVHLKKDFWAIIDVAAAVMFLVYAGRRQQISNGG